MMQLLRKFLIVFITLSAVAYVLSHFFDFQWGNHNFWDDHGFLFIFFFAIFPRVTLLLSSVPATGLFWWLGWAFVPRLFYALIATYSYWQNNPVVVALFWLIAIGGESSEKFVVIRRGYRGPYPTKHRNKSTNGEIIDIEPVNSKRE